jgi:hypothetical protein
MTCRETNARPSRTVLVIPDAQDQTAAAMATTMTVPTTADDHRAEDGRSADVPPSPGL